MNGRNGNILQTIAQSNRERVEKAKKTCSAESVRREAESRPKISFPFEKAIRHSKEMAFICECKKASPSKGVIAESYPYLNIALEYERAGATAISVLTEPNWFLGQLIHLEDIARTVKIPCLRKDFVVDPYMIYEARIHGASAVLLIAAILEEEEIRDGIARCDELGMTALVEAHDEAEVEKALSAGARVLGINHRNLTDFSMDFSRSQVLRSMIPESVLFVAESGVKEPRDVRKLKLIGADAILIGETMMKATDKKATLEALRNG